MVPAQRGAAGEVAVTGRTAWLSPFAAGARGWGAGGIQMPKGQKPQLLKSGFTIGCTRLPSLDRSHATRGPAVGDASSVQGRAVWPRSRPWRSAPRYRRRSRHRGGTGHAFEEHGHFPREAFASPLINPMAARYAGKLCASFLLRMRGLLGVTRDG